MTFKQCLHRDILYAFIIVEDGVYFTYSYIYFLLILDAQLVYHLPMAHVTVYNLSFNSNCRILAAELNCTLPKYKFISSLYLGKTKFKYQFTGLTTLGCLAAIYILNMYLKRINKKICEYMLWNL